MDKRFDEYDKKIEEIRKEIMYIKKVVNWKTGDPCDYILGRPKAFPDV